jgi:transcriptional regulator with XRE-family HTH domain
MDRHIVQIAQRIRRWRNDAGFTLQQVADRSGVAASTVHKIEKNQTVPTISVLLKITAALNRRADELLIEESPENAAALRRKQDRLVLGTEERSRVEQLALGIANSSIDLFRVHHQPGTGSGEEKGRLQYNGEVIVLCEAGELTFEVGEEKFKIEAGDSLHFKASVPHCWVNTGDGPASALFFGTLPKGLQKGLSERLEQLHSKESDERSETGISTEHETDRQ